MRETSVGRRPVWREKTGRGRENRGGGGGGAAGPPGRRAARGGVVDEAARDHEMGLRVVVAEDESRAQEHEPCDEAGGRGGGRERAGYNHEASSG